MRGPAGAQCPSWFNRLWPGGRSAWLRNGAQPPAPSPAGQDRSPHAVGLWAGGRGRLCSCNLTSRSQTTLADPLPLSTNTLETIAVYWQSRFSSRRPDASLTPGGQQPLHALDARVVLMAGVQANRTVDGEGARGSLEEKRAVAV